MVDEQIIYVTQLLDDLANVKGICGEMKGQPTGLATKGVYIIQPYT
jgi:hypothetical protein